MKWAKDTAIIPLIIVGWSGRFVAISNLSKLTLTIDFSISIISM